MLLHHYRFAPDESLFDVEAFRAELAGSRSPIAPFKAALREIQARLDARFRDGADIRDLVHGDRKSTRLNSSHVRISYAVFCLKKKMNSQTFRLGTASAAGWLLPPGS